MVFNRTVLYSGKSEYGSYKVVDTPYNGRPARVLYGSQRTPQSGVASDENPELLFSYNQRFMEIVMSVQPSRVLVIGGGACSLPTALFHQFPELSIDVVEIDSLLVRLAQDFFELPVSDRLTVHIGDGKKYLETSLEKYDLIIIDAFSGYTIPHHLLEKSTIELYRQHLTKSGVVALNFISDYKPRRQSLAHEIIASFGELFTQRSLYRADTSYAPGDHQNYVLVASQVEVHFDYLQSDEQDLLL